MCAGDKESWGGGGLFGGYQMDEAVHDRIVRIRGKRGRKGGKEKKEEKGGMGLQLLFGGTFTVVWCS